MTRPAKPVPLSRSILVKLLGLFVAVFAAGAALLTAVITGQSGAELQADMTALLESGGAAMRAVHREQVEKDRDLMVRIASNLATSSEREIADFPFDLYAGDEEALKSRLAERIATLSHRSQENVSVVAEMMLGDAESRIADETARLSAIQAESGRAFARTLFLRTAFAASFLLLLLLFTLLSGLYVVVLRPLRSFTDVVARIARGARGERIATTSSDEFGMLGRAFDDMAERVAGSQDRLEAEVARKTKELERAAAELVQAEKMVSIGRLARGVAHEFNNLLGGISGCAEEALEDAPPGPLRESLDIIRKTSRRACVITANLLTFSRGEGLPRSEVDLSNILEEAVHLLQPEAAARGVRIDFGSFGDCSVMANPGEIQQVCLNLLINGVQAARRSGGVTAEVRGGEREVSITVEDDGPGVDNEVKDRIFEPFFTTREREGGTGLGLAVVHGIVTGLGGAVTVEDRKPSGARFVVKLPRHAVHAVDPSGAKPELR